MPTWEPLDLSSSSPIFHKIPLRLTHSNQHRVEFSLLTTDLSSLQFHDLLLSYNGVFTHLQHAPNLTFRYGSIGIPNQTSPDRISPYDRGHTSTFIPFYSVSSFPSAWQEALTRSNGMIKFISLTFEYSLSEWQDIFAANKAEREIRLIYRTTTAERAYRLTWAREGNWKQKFKGHEMAWTRPATLREGNRWKRGDMKEQPWMEGYSLVAPVGYDNSEPEVMWPELKHHDGVVDRKALEEENRRCGYGVKAKEETPYIKLWRQQQEKKSLVNRMKMDRTVDRDTERLVGDLELNGLKVWVYFPREKGVPLEFYPRYHVKVQEFQAEAQYGD
jgi:hypothetical protein